MNWDQVSGQWKQLKGKVKQKWGNLTDDDLDKIEGKREQLVGKVQQRYGIAKGGAGKNVDKWTNARKDRILNALRAVEHRIKSVLAASPLASTAYAC